jgi:hypothetical protein
MGSGQTRGWLGDRVTGSRKCCKLGVSSLLLPSCAFARRHSVWVPARASGHRNAVPRGLQRPCAGAASPDKPCPAVHDEAGWRGACSDAPPPQRRRARACARPRPQAARAAGAPAAPVSCRRLLQRSAAETNAFKGDNAGRPSPGRLPARCTAPRRRCGGALAPASAPAPAAAECHVGVKQGVGLGQQVPEIARAGGEGAEAVLLLWFYGRRAGHGGGRVGSGGVQGWGRCCRVQAGAKRAARRRPGRAPHLRRPARRVARARRQQQLRRRAHPALAAARARVARLGAEFSTRPHARGRGRRRRHRGHGAGDLGGEGGRAVSAAAHGPAGQLRWLGEQLVGQAAGWASSCGGQEPNAQAAAASGRALTLPLQTSCASSTA